jgi:hypothetical protein
LPGLIGVSLTVIQDFVSEHDADLADDTLPSGTFGAEIGVPNLIGVSLPDIRLWVSEFDATDDTLPSGTCGADAGSPSLTGVSLPDIRDWVSECDATDDTLPSGTCGADVGSPSLTGVSLPDIRDCVSKDDAGRASANVWQTARRDRACRGSGHHRRTLAIRSRATGSVLAVVLRSRFRPTAPARTRRAALQPIPRDTMAMRPGSR